MITIEFKPSDDRNVMIAVIKKYAHITLRDARDAVDLQRIRCEKKYKAAVIEALEEHGGIVEHK